MASRIVDQNPVKTGKPSQWVGLILVYLIIPLVIWACGGDTGWWQAWIYSGIIFLAGVGGRVWADRRHPGMQVERTKFVRAQDVKRWDKILAPLMAVSFAYPLYIVAGLDHRFGWSVKFPLWLNIFGLILCALGYGFAIWALVENRFFTSTVRIQTERGHAVCDAGPYRFVRHPGYAGNLLSLAGIVLALSSLWTLVPAAAALIIAMARTELEDRTLQEELQGYREYAQRVRYRLVPGIY
jgi:protein-S-isoprenylcysteine O-methyltransferase Ste14